MAFDSLPEQTEGRTFVTPMDIAHQTLFTAKEKIALLTQLKADATTVAQEGGSVGFSPDEIEEAIAEVRQDVEHGVGARTAAQGDF